MLKVWSGAKVKCRESVTGRAAFARVSKVSDTALTLDYLQSERRTLNGTQFNLTAFNQQFFIECPTQAIELKGRRLDLKPLGIPVIHRLAIPMITCGIHAPFELSDGKTHRKLAVVGISAHAIAFELAEPVALKSAFKIAMSFDSSEVEFDAVAIQQIQSQFGCYVVCLVANQNRMAVGIWSTLMQAA